MRPHQAPGRQALSRVVTEVSLAQTKHVSTERGPTITGAAAAVDAIRALRTEGLDVRALQDYYASVSAH